MPRICVPAAAITRDALAVRMDQQTGQVVIYPMEDFRKVVEINMIAPIYWAIELVAAVAKIMPIRGLKRWQPEEGLPGAIVFLGSIASAGNVGQISYSSTKAGLEGAASTTDGRVNVVPGSAVGVIQLGFTPIPRWCGRWAGGRIRPDQSRSANAVETAYQARGNRRCHLLYGHQRCRQWRTCGPMCNLLAHGHLTGGQQFNQTI